MVRPEILAENIKKCRTRTGMTQSDLAKKLFVSSQAISKWESGQSVPDLSNLCMLADVFSTSVDKLLGHSPRSTEGKLFIGIDGGATKTEFVLFAENGNILKRIYLDGSNPNVCGMEQACDILKTGIDTLLSICPDVAGVCAGVAGYLSGNNSTNFQSFFKSAYPLLKINLNSDICNVVDSVPQLKSCVAVICGTGFAVYAYAEGTLSRVGAWGYLLDNIGGGFGIGKEALRTSLAQRDGFGEKTLITELVEQVLGGEVWENIQKIYAGGDSFIASFAPVVFEAYKKGDKKAKDILCQHADYIAEMLNFTIKTYHCNNNVVMSGGLLSNNSIIVDLLKERLNDNITIIVPELPQIFGACYRGCTLFGKPSESFCENFSKNYLF